MDVMRINLFGLTDISPQKVEALAPHDRSMLARMVGDVRIDSEGRRGLDIRKTLGAMGMDPSAFNDAYRQLHAHRAFEFDRVDDRPLAADTVTAISAVLTFLMGEGGKVALSAAKIAARIGLTKVQVACAIERLVVDGFVSRGRVGERAKVATVALTKRGRAHVESLTAGVEGEGAVDA